MLLFAKKIVWGGGKGPLGSASVCIECRKKDLVSMIVVEKHPNSRWFFGEFYKIFTNALLR